MIVIGHGFPAVTEYGPIGAVELCDGKDSQSKQLDTRDVNKIMPKVYIGLHCYAEYFVKPLDPKIETFDLTGDQVGQNTHIKAFLEKSKIASPRRS